MQKPSVPKGTRDFGPADVKKRKYILNTIESVFIKYGFMPLETPVMENLSTLEGKYGEEGDKLLFRILNSGDAFKSIKDKQGEVTVNNAIFKNSEVSEKGLRYDLTVPFARFVVMNKDKISFPFKRYQMQPVWRADRPQKGRYREFWQCDADVVGSNSLLNELDLIQIYDESFRKLGLESYEIRINNRKILSGIATVVRSSNDLNLIATAIDKLDKIGKDGVKQELLSQGLNEGQIEVLFDAISFDGDENVILDKLEKLLKDSEEGLKGIEEIRFLQNKIQAVAPNINLKLDISLARGLGYYTGTIMEVVSKKGTLTSSIGGGGRYDNLTGIFGLPGISGVGISFGLDRIYDVMEELELFPEQFSGSETRILFCPFSDDEMDEAMLLVKQFREANIPSEVYPDLPKSKKEIEKPMLKPMQHADNLQIPFTAFQRNGQWVLKDMKAKTELTLSANQLIQHFIK